MGRQYHQFAPEETGNCVKTVMIARLGLYSNRHGTVVNVGLAPSSIRRTAVGLVQVQGFAALRQACQKRPPVQYRAPRCIVRRHPEPCILHIFQNTLAVLRHTHQHSSCTSPPSSFPSSSSSSPPPPHSPAKPPKRFSSLTSKP